MGASLSLAMAMILAAPSPGHAQQRANGGSAFGVDIFRVARTLDMQESYPRAIYAYIRANPSVWQDQEFYVNLLIYLMTRSPDFSCDAAFDNEFARRDYFTRALSQAPQLRQVIEGMRIPNRFDAAFRIATGEYDFVTGILPFTQTRVVGGAAAITSRAIETNARHCARDVLRGTGVNEDAFPWRFTVVNEQGEHQAPRFPFNDSLQLSTNDARTLFDRFGRELYAIVGYQVQAANTGERLIQVIPTDGQLFGLSSDAVVRVQSFAHPTLPQSSYLEIAHPLSVDIADIGSEMEITFQQDGFRAVGSGQRMDRGTGLTEGGLVPVTGSAAVGQSSFVMRLATPGLQVQGLGVDDETVDIILFGSVRFPEVTQTSAPVSGTAFFHAANGYDVQKPFSGAFRPAPPEDPAPREEASQLDLGSGAAADGGATD